MQRFLFAGSLILSCLIVGSAMAQTKTDNSQQLLKDDSFREEFQRFEAEMKDAEKGELFFKEQAVHWLLKAAEANDPKAMNNLGRMYLKGIRVEKDEKEALKWFQKAAAANDPDAMQQIGWMYDNGLGGLPKDEKEAFQWYLKASKAR